jgi:hypothetical protein
MAVGGHSLGDAVPQPAVDQQPVHENDRVATAQIAVTNHARFELDLGVTGRDRLAAARLGQIRD